VDEILEKLLQMLNKEVVDQCKQSVQYFQVLKSYVQLVCLWITEHFEILGYWLKYDCNRSKELCQRIILITSLFISMS